MAGRKAETLVKLARERALREKRERKQAKKDARAEAKRLGIPLEPDAPEEPGEPEALDP
jgi:hypothetical protein